MFVLRRRNTYVCQLDDSVFPFFSGADKETARLAAEARANQIIVAQTQAGVKPDATLTERKAVLAADRATGLSY